MSLTPKIAAPTDAIVQVTRTTICGTDFGGAAEMKALKVLVQA
jgi:threonine dehydrogenase-like Zn-dependent dehydrogenase